MLERLAFSVKLWHYVFSTWSSLLLERPAFSGKRWHCILYKEQVVAQTTNFLRHVFAQYFPCVAACCQTTVLSPASVGALFSTWSSGLQELPDFFTKRWQYIPYKEQLVAGTTCFLQQALAQHSLHGAASCWSDLLSPARVGTILSTWSSLSLELPDYFSRRWHYILDME